LEDAIDDNPCDDDELDGTENGEDEESEPDGPLLALLRATTTSPCRGSPATAQIVSLMGLKPA
jgi:hypothetical protein